MIKIVKNCFCRTILYYFLFLYLFVKHYLLYIRNMMKMG